MKQGRSVINIVMAALAVVLALYFGVYLYNSLSSPFSTTLAYSYTLLDSIRADGLLVRREQLLPDQSGIVEVTLAEGERAASGQTVALVYRDSQAQEDQARISSLQLEAEILSYAMSEPGDVESAARLDEGILNSLVSLRDAAARSDYSRLEEQVVDLKSGVLKRGCTYGEGVSPADLSTRLKALRGEIEALSHRSKADITRVRAPRSGVFSHLVDGLENLTPEDILNDPDPGRLRSLMEEVRPGVPGSVGKLITSDRWYFAAVIPAEAAGRLKEGGFATVRFSGDFSQELPMRVDRLVLGPDGEASAVFSSDRYLARTTLLRSQTAEIIFGRYSGLRLPKEALRLVKETVTDRDTGEEKEISRLGVYTIVAGRTEFKDAEVVTEGSGYYILRPVGAGRKALRAGDEVIVRGTGLYSGQQLRH